jgi:hypothetical protein
MDILNASIAGAKWGVIYGAPLSMVYVVVAWIVKSIMIAIFKGKKSTLATIACAVPGSVVFLFALGEESFDKISFALVMMICVFGFCFAYFLFVNPLLSQTVELDANAGTPSKP